MVNNVPQRVKTLCSFDRDIMGISKKKTSHTKYVIHWYTRKCCNIPEVFIASSRQERPLRLRGSWGAVSKLQKFLWSLSHVSRPITWSLIRLKPSAYFTWRCRFIDSLKFKTHPSPMENSDMSNCYLSLFYYNYILMRTVAICIEKRKCRQATQGKKMATYRARKLAHSNRIYFVDL